MWVGPPPSRSFQVTETAKAAYLGGRAQFPKEMPKAVSTTIAASRKATHAGRSRAQDTTTDLACPAPW